MTAARRQAGRAAQGRAGRRTQLEVELSLVGNGAACLSISVELQIIKYA